MYMLFLLQLGSPTFRFTLPPFGFQTFRFTFPPSFGAQLYELPCPLWYPTLRVTLCLWYSTLELPSPPLPIFLAGSLTKNKKFDTVPEGTICNNWIKIN